ncbi:MAG TPA: sigma-70 family RNA polymerase sigma factor [Polyangiaceae bacterium]
MNGSGADRRPTAVTALVPPFSRVHGVSSDEAASGVPSFDSTYAEYFPFVWRSLRALGVAPHALDDAAQDVFVVVHRQLSSFAGQSTLRTWLFGIVRNVASNHRRARARMGDTTVREDLRATGQGPEDSARDRQAADFIRRFLDSLDDRKREVFVLCLLEELSVPEAAEALGIPLNTAYTRLRRVRAEFRRALLEQRENP